MSNKIHYNVYDAFYSQLCIKYIINLEVHFVGYLYIMVLINARKMNIKMNVRLLPIELSSIAFRRVRKISKSDYYERRLVCPHGTTRLPMDGVPLNFTFANFSKICRENSSFLKSDKNSGYFT
jgi:hypothetical protein